MKNKKLWGAVLYWGFTLVPFLISAIFYSRLPAEMVTHWGFNNEPNGYSSRAMACWGMPAVLVGVAVLINVAFAFDPKSKNINASKKIKAVGRWCIPVIAVMTQVVVVLSNLGVEISVGKLIGIPVGLLIVLIGNYLPKCKPNYTMGIRLPWTLNSEENWIHTHRFAAVWWVIGGILLMVQTFLSWSGIFYIALALLLLPPTAYSFWFYCREKKQR